MKTRIKQWILAVAGLLLTQAACAGLAHGKLEFLQPTGTVSATENIDIWVRLTLDADSPALTFSSSPLTGISPTDLSPTGYHYDSATGTYTYANFASIDRVYWSAYMSCAASFNCLTYGINFADQHDPDLPGPVYLDHFTLEAGQSYDYLFGQFTPQAGGAPAGTYSLYDISMTLDYSGVGADGQWLGAVNRPVIASSCSGADRAGCSFTRTVLAVPEPSSPAVLAFGLACMAGVMRRRSSAR